jgi:hypothetical protein
MKSTKCLVVVNGFFGDIAFSTSIARKLKAERQYDYVDYLIGLPQMVELLSNDPNINKVHLPTQPSPYPSIEFDTSIYDKVIQIGQMNFDIPPPTQMQLAAGVRNPDTEYHLYTNAEYDAVAQQAIDQLKHEHGKPVLCILSNWEERSFIFTKEQYEQGIDVPNLGYGGKHRNIQHIVDNLSKHFTLLEVGFPSNTSQVSTASIPTDNQKSILFECSLMKYCDAFIGAEGGLCNLAAGVGTRTIVTSDFVHQLYGWNGVLRKIKEPKLGPVHYFPYVNHIELDPYLSDEEVAHKIIENV